MKKIEAIVKPSKLSNVKDSLYEIGLTGMTVLDVKGFGRQRGKEGINDNEEYEDEFLAKTLIQLIVEDEQLDKAVEAVKNAAFSGKIGDGKIFISSIEQVIRIRTGEKGSDAV